ncbi:DUF1700 domain-containing protein [Paenibacillus roseipurpureus]|uniref:DUF1700 domain-containing protein n=1 Tax=Paenibacillus roseopurpureus TaxID=2918901 RepID=A0AA96LMY7_9BACL|nr:DUF1700 domain-containing protein [Paenibacillus sp. MBLB1832]WNR44715.1 DUF1700 domain-containing protein [Paenibacillus sp. MBLB1832]
MSKSDYFKELNYRLRGLPEKERHNILKVYEELFQKAVENGKHEDEVAQSLGYPRVPNWDAHKEAPSVKEDLLRPTGEAPPMSVASDDLPEPPAAPYMEPNEPVFDSKIAPQAPPAWEPPAYTKPPQPHFPPMYSAPYPKPYPTKTDTGIKAIIISIMLGFFNLMFVVGPWFGVCAALIAFFAAGFALLIAPVIGVLTSLAGMSGSDFQFVSFAMLACFGLGIILTTLSSMLLKLFFKLSWKYIQFNAKLIKGV